MCNSTILQIFISRGSFTSYIGYACYFLFPLTITGYLLTYETFADEKYFKFLYWIEFGSIIIITMLQLSHIIILSNVLWIVHIELITTFIMTIITFIRNHNVISKQETEIYTAFIIISVFLTMDILRYYSTRPSTGRVKYSIYGLFILPALYSLLHAITSLNIHATAYIKSLHLLMAWLKLTTALHLKSIWKRSAISHLPAAA